MSKLQELIQRLCPNGVEYKKLEQIGSLYGGLTGKTKEDFIEGNAKFITYLNIYSNPSLSLDIKDTVKVSPKEKQNIVSYGDVLFTGSSETPDECGMSSVLTQRINYPLYLNSFCFGLRLNNISEFNLDFLKHLLRSDEIRGQIAKTANGVTRFNISKKLFVKIAIPVPPREVQDEIAKILDRFDVYAAELQAELQARKEQYEYYRNLLLTFNPAGCAGEADDEQEGCVTTRGGHSYPIQWKTMGEVGTFIRGNGLQKKDFTESGVGCIHYGQIYTYYGTFTTETKSFVSPEMASKLLIVNPGNLVIACTSENVEDVGKAVAWLGNNDIVTGGHSVVFRHNINPKYVAYFFQTQTFFAQKKRYAYGAKVIDIKTEDLAKIVIPVPPLELQEKIVAILDRFETLVNDLSEGLPAEIAAVKEQYEYYRNRLLTFKEKTA